MPVRVCVSEALTQVEAARQLGTNHQYINRCEAGDRRIDFIEVADVAALYRRPLEYFLEGGDSGSDPTC